MVTSVLEPAPGEAAQVDIGKGPEIIDGHTGEAFKTLVFVMLLAWSRHQRSVKWSISCEKMSLPACMICLIGNSRARIK